LTLLLACGSLWAAPAGIERELKVRIPMRDGVMLATNIFRPAGTAKLPLILVRTPYNKGTDIPPAYRPFLERGYVVAIQDVRGRYDSEGLFQPLKQEPADTEDTLNWLARQSWSNGRIGMTGGSYLGIVQWKAALLNNRYLKAIFPVVSGCDDYTDRFYSPGGALKLAQRLEWMAENVRAPEFPRPKFRDFVLHLPLRSSDRLAAGRTVDFYQTALDHPEYDDFWKRLSTREKLASVKVPVFSVGGWYDNFVESDLEAFRLMRNRGQLPGGGFRARSAAAGPHVSERVVRLLAERRAGAE
jgi:putative CocE/NonD family hydrolase